jgi:hypothetical protein
MHKQNVQCVSGIDSDYEMAGALGLKVASQALGESSQIDVKTIQAGDCAGCCYGTSRACYDLFVGEALVEVTKIRERSELGDGPARECAD